jgi:isoleucyl-tRNA synthetase
LHLADKRPQDAVAAEANDANHIWIVARASAHGKCVRCWNKQADVGQHSAHPELCGRCVANIEGPGEVRRYA